MGRSWEPFFVVYSLTTTIFDYMYDVHVYVRIIIPQIHQCISISLNMHIFKLQNITLYAYLKHYFSLVFTHIYYGNFWHIWDNLGNAITYIQ